MNQVVVEIEEAHTALLSMNPALWYDIGAEGDDFSYLTIGTDHEPVYTYHHQYSQEIHRLNRKRKLKSCIDSFFDDDDNEDVKG